MYLVEDGERLIFETLVNAGLWYGPRTKLEGMPQFVQVLPYAILMDSNGRLLSYKRTKQGGEGRLYERWSVGFGGHVEFIDWVYFGMSDYPTNDCPLQDVLECAMMREISEEVRGITLNNSKWMGFVLDDDPVGEVHLGVVRLFHVSPELGTGGVQANEDAISNVHFEYPDTLLQYPTMEGWSVHVIRSILKNASAWAPPV